MTMVQVVSAFAIQAGRYIKIGRKVHCDIYIRFANGDLSTGVHAQIGNLPFAIIMILMEMLEQVT